MREQPCCITGKRTGGLWTPVEAAHIKTRSTGGDDVGNAIPLSGFLHIEQHAIGWTAFEKKWRIDRHVLAKKYAEEWLAAYPGGGPQ